MHGYEYACFGTVSDFARFPGDQWYTYRPRAQQHIKLADLCKHIVAGHAAEIAEMRHAQAVQFVDKNQVFRRASRRACRRENS